MYISAVETSPTSTLVPLFRSPLLLTSFLFIHHDKTGTYEITDVQPALEEMDTMVATLNASNSFDVFVREMRAKFREL
jgi:hypothetical protein